MHRSATSGGEMRITTVGALALCAACGGSAVRRDHLVQLRLAILPEVGRPPALLLLRLPFAEALRDAIGVTNIGGTVLIIGNQ